MSLSTSKAHKKKKLSRFQLVRANEGIIASNQSANRDEDVFENPDEFNMNRKWPAEDPLGFGFGDHRCIAEYLAKTELTTVFGT
jgi:nitric oxide reductase